MATTYEAIATVTATTSVATIDFTSIPQTYTDLVVKISTRAGNGLGQFLTFNSSTTGYSARRLQGSGSSATSETGGATNIFFLCNDNRSTASTFGNSEIYVPNYTSSNNKSVSIDSVTESNDTSYGYQALVAGLWSNSAAITNITLTPETGNYVQYSTATLYGIKNS